MYSPTRVTYPPSGGSHFLQSLYTVLLLLVISSGNYTIPSVGWYDLYEFNISPCTVVLVGHYVGHVSYQLQPEGRHSLYSSSHIEYIPSISLGTPDITIVDKHLKFPPPRDPLLY